MNELENWLQFSMHCYVRCPSQWHKTSKCAKCCFWRVNAPADQEYVDDKDRLVKIKNCLHTIDGVRVNGIVSVHPPDCFYFADTECVNGYPVRQLVYYTNKDEVTERVFDPPGMPMYEYQGPCKGWKSRLIN